MSFKDIAKTVGKGAVKGTLSYLETASDSNSRKRNYTPEQREEFAEYSRRMGELKSKIEDWD